MQRRNFIKHTTAGVVLPTLLQGFGIKVCAEPQLPAILPPTDTDKVLIIIQLDGGNDGLNMAMPADQYAQLLALRPNVTHPEAQYLALNNVSNVRLNPQMDGIRTLFNEERVAIVQAVGYPNHSSSHPTGTLNMLNGAQPEGGYASTGVFGRYLHHANEYPNYPDVLPTDPVAIEFGDYASLLLQDSAASMSVLLNSSQHFCNLYWGSNTNDIGCDLNEPIPNPDLEAGKAKAKLSYTRQLTKLSNHYANRIKQTFDLGAIVGVGPTDSDINFACNIYSSNELTRQLHIIARLIKGGLNTRIYMVKHTGFDLHGNQQYLHGVRLGELSTAIKKFMDDITTMGIDDRVIGMTVSEFGRTIKQNGSQGTDHGTSSSMLLFGTHIAGGIYGTNPILPSLSAFSNPATFDAANNIARQYDIRSIYSTILSSWFCTPAAQLNDIIQPSVSTADLQNIPTIPIINNSPCCTVTVTPIISGNNNVCTDGTYAYSVAAVAGATYIWTIQGGTIVAGQGTNSVQVIWANGIAGTINVQQTAP